MATECKHKEKCFNYPSKCDTCNAMSDLINHHPCFKNKDVVEVVRCKDCGMSRETEDEGYLFCMQFADTVDFQAFCSYGERKCDK